MGQEVLSIPDYPVPQDHQWHLSVQQVPVDQLHPEIMQQLKYKCSTWIKYQVLDSYNNGKAYIKVLKDPYLIVESEKKAFGRTVLHSEEETL